VKDMDINMKVNKRISAKRIATLGMLAAVSIVLMMLIRIPFPPAPFLEYDPADVPIIIATLLFGPWWGVAISLAVSLIQGFTVSASSGIIGAVMHFIAAGSFSATVGFVYAKNKTLKGLIIGLIIGSLVHTVAMVLMNLILTPIFMQTPFEAVLQMMIPIILPYNLIKVAVNSVVSGILFKALMKASKRFHFYF